MSQPIAHPAETDHPGRATVHRVAPNTTVQLGARSWRGARRSANQDQYLAASICTSLDIHHSSPLSLAERAEGIDSALLLAVADGIGEQRLGGRASGEPMRGLVEYVRGALRVGATRQRGARGPSMDSTAEANRMLQGAVSEGRQRQETAAQATPSDTAAALTAALLLWPYLYVARVGDGTCQLFRDGHAIALTADHTVAQPVAAERAEEVTDDLPYHHVLWKALGGGTEAERKPELRRAELRREDVLVLSSDGLTQCLQPEELVGVAREALRGPDRPLRRVDSWVRQRAPSDDATIVIATVMAV